jgi:hypothetical protein
MLQVTPEDRLYDKPHNAILEVAATTGALGVIAYLSIYASIVYTAHSAFKKKKINKDVFVIFTLAYVAHFIANLFLFDTLETYLGFFILAGFIGAISHFKEEEEYKEKFDKRYILILIPLIVGASWFSYEHGYKNLMSSYYGSKAIQAFQQANFDAGYYSVLKLGQYMSDASRDVVITSSSVFFDYNHAMGIGPEEDNKMANLYIDQLDKLTEKYPENILIKAVQARFFGLKGDSESIEKGLDVINQALDKSPNYVDFLSMRSALYIIQEKYDKALDDLNQVTDYSDYFSEPYYKKSYIHFIQKEYDKSLDNFIIGAEKGFQYTSDYSKKMAILALNLNREDDYLQPYLDHCENNPQDMQLFANLASAYAHLGKKDKVLEITNLILSTDSRYKKVVDEFLTEMNYK